MDWTRGHTLGRGSTATVSTAVAHHSGEVFAVKSAELHRSEFLKREQGILSTLRCPQIVAYKGCDVTYEDGALLYNLFMEYAPRGTLADQKGMHDEGVVGSYARQILLGLSYLHSNGIVHCDVKGENVLVTDQGAKIADLGCARRVGELGIAGTPVFMAPEVARGEQQGFPADVWALGCTVLEMITGNPPWHDVSDPVAALYRIGFSGEVPETPSFVSEQGKDFLCKCLNRDPCERWSVGELLTHGFVRESSYSVCKDKVFAFESSNSDTPTSVLEQGFWDSLETTQDPTRDHFSWDSPSPRDRIRRLCGDATTSTLFDAEPIWEWDHHWVSVRSNEVKDKELEEFHIPNGQAQGSFEKTEDCGSDTVCILREEKNGLVIFYEPKIVVTNGIQFSRWNANIDYCYLSSNCGCCNRESLSSCPCIKIVPHEKFDSQNKEIFIMHCFLPSLFLFNSTLGELNSLQLRL